MVELRQRTAPPRLHHPRPAFDFDFNGKILSIEKVASSRTASRREEVDLQLGRGTHILLEGRTASARARFSRRSSTAPPRA